MSFDPNFLVEHSETSDSRSYISSDKTIENPYYDYDITTLQTVQNETLHDPQDNFQDTHQKVTELLELILLLLLILIASQLLQTPIF